MPARLLRLLSLLQSRRVWAGAELAEKLDVTVRTVRRDIGRLRELGYHVESVTGVAGGYRLVSGKDLPPLLLDEEEAVAIAVGLRTAAGGTVAGIEEASVRALAKLEQVLPVRLRHRVAAVSEATVRVPGHRGLEVDSMTLAVVAAACRDHEILTFGYERRDGTTASRRVEPHELVVTHGRWYLLAYDLRRDGWRNFRVDRISEPTPTCHHFTPRAKPSPDSATYLSRGVSGATYRYTAQAVVRAPARTVLARLPTLIPHRVEPIDEHTCTVRFGSDSVDRIAQDLVALGADYTLTCSQDLRDHLRAVAQRLLGAASP
ncbi:DNA-binding transcriptional regulator [Longimycelium tulufanense]|uniref:DNA-binding transcriptional regulator n=1 Tax=Longimycelium tulufanense TaxID=907463 RepID=A0A8J3FY39_9PSEU|nr:YafY family protein [Longimycelium tulufanense]GGM73055.1 DNA-binding transcriptional regulator [Longimycelium tulufanense]